MKIGHEASILFIVFLTCLPKIDPSLQIRGAFQYHRKATLCLRGGDFETRYGPSKPFGDAKPSSSLARAAAAAAAEAASAAAAFAEARAELAERRRAELSGGPYRTAGIVADATERAAWAKLLEGDSDAAQIPPSPEPGRDHASVDGDDGSARTSSPGEGLAAANGPAAAREKQQASGPADVLQVGL